MYICNDCPRRCNVDREIKLGYCGSGVKARVAKTVIPFEYEEPCLGKLSAIFFSGCNLRCSYCQNYKISRAAVGQEYTDAELAAMFDGAVGALDLVTPTHFLGAVERAVRLMRVPHTVIWNTSGYETEESVERETEFCDVFLTDFKYLDETLSAKFSNAPDYGKRAIAAISRMRRVKDEFATDADGNRTLVRGLVIRHLVLPGCVKDSLNVLDAIATEFGTDTIVSLMSQFTPNGKGAPDARLKHIEYKVVAEHALKLGFRNGYFQEFSSASESYTPAFDAE